MLFLIYISKVFDKVTKVNLHIISLSFVDDLRFIAFGYSIKAIIKALEKVPQIVFEWGNANIMTYDIAEMETVIFSKSHC